MKFTRGQTLEYISAQSVELVKLAEHAKSETLIHIFKMDP